MSSLIQKARLLILSNLHDLLDSAIDMNDLGAVRQKVRDLENAKNEIGDEAAIATGHVGQLELEMSALQIEMDTTDRNITMLLSDSDPDNDQYAIPLETTLMSCEEEMASMQESLGDANTAAVQLTEAATKLTNRHREMLQSLRRLERMERSSKAKDRATEALKSIGNLTGASDSVDDVARRLRDRRTASDAKFNRALGGIDDSPTAAVNASKAQARIAARREKFEQATH